MSEFTLKSSQFRSEREESWEELEGLLRKLETLGIRGLSEEDLHRLPTLYRSVVSSLSVARAISLDRSLLDYLTNLASRAYIWVYGTKRRPGEAILDFILRRLPGAVRLYRWFLAVSIACMAAGFLCGFLLTMADIERYYSFVPLELAGGRTPAASTESLRDVLYTDEGEYEEGSRLELFATFLFTNNAKVGILCFALGFAAGIPVIFLLFYNGLMLGAMTALYHSRGLGGEFLAWVFPHGVTELLAVCLCGAAGLVFGMAVVFPGEHTRLENLARRGRKAALVVIGAVVLLFLAALIEGFFRQLVNDISIRWALAAATCLAWIAYFGFVGRRDSDEGR